MASWFSKPMPEAALAAAQAKVLEAMPELQAMLDPRNPQAAQAQQELLQMIQEVAQMKEPPKVEKMGKMAAIGRVLAGGATSALSSALIGGGAGFAVYGLAGSLGTQGVKETFGFTPDEKKVKQALGHPENASKSLEQVKEEMTYGTMELAGQKAGLFAMVGGAATFLMQSLQGFGKLEEIQNAELVKNQLKQRIYLSLHGQAAPGGAPQHRVAAHGAPNIQVPQGIPNNRPGIPAQGAHAGHA